MPPNKYSHRVVLYNYASAGLIQPNDAFLGSAPQRGRARSPAREADSYHEYLSSSSRQSVYSDSEAKRRISHETGSSRSGVVQSPRSGERRTRPIRIQRSVEEPVYTLVEEKHERREERQKGEREAREGRGVDRGSAVPLAESMTAEKQERKEELRSDSWPSGATAVPISSPPLRVTSASNQDSTLEDTHQNCSEMVCGVNCFQPALSHINFDLSGPNLPRLSTSNGEPVTGPRSTMPAHARGDSRPVAPPSQLSRNHLESPTPPSTGKTLIYSHLSARRQPSPPRPASTLTKIFDPLPTTADFSDFDSFSSPASPVQQSALSRRFSLDSLSSFSSFSSLNTDAPTLTVKSPAQQDHRQVTSHSRTQSASHSFWNNVASCGDTLALSFPPPTSGRTSVDDLSSYPPDIPTRRQLYQPVVSQASSASQSQSHRAAMLTSPPSIPLNGQRALQQEAKKNWFGVGSVLKKKNVNDGTVRNSSGMVVGSRS